MQPINNDPRSTELAGAQSECFLGNLDNDGSPSITIEAIIRNLLKIDAKLLAAGGGREEKMDQILILLRKTNFGNN